MKRITLTLLLLAGTVAVAQADTYTFKDILKPHGKARTVAEKLADGRKCGANKNDYFPARDTAQFTACMQTLGWALANIKHSPPSDEAAADPDDTTVVHFDDQHRKPDGRWRGKAVLQADTQRCSGYGALDYESHSFKRCMASVGWRYSSTHRATRPAYGGDDETPPPQIDTTDIAPVSIPAPPPPVQYDVLTGQALP